MPTQKKRLLLILIAVAAVAVIVVMCMGLSGLRSTTSLKRRQQIEKMAAYLNDKYGYILAYDDCTYYREEDYHYQQPILDGGLTYDIPYIAIFQKGEEYITVTDRNGFLGDDHQLGELNALLCDYFEQMTGLKIYFVEVRNASNGNTRDHTLNQILHEEFNEKLAANNIDRFVECIWNTNSLQLIFYFTAEEDLHTQINKITWKLGMLERYKNLRSLRFYISGMDSPHIYYSQPRVHLQSADENGREYSYSYIMGHYHVVNELEHHYPAGDGVYYPISQFNTFIAGGYCMLDRGYNSGFGDREIIKINSFGVVDLCEDQLAEYQKEMVTYGKFRGYTILFQPGEDDAYSKLNIADVDKYSWTFRWNSGPVEIYAFRYGQLVELKTAYRRGYLSPENMDAILLAHKEHFAENFSWNHEIEPGDLSDELRAEIVAYFSDIYPGMGKNDDVDTVAGLQYYGTYDDYVILMLAGACCAVSEVEIGDFAFKWHSFPLCLWAYKGGQIQDLKELYESGAISDAALEMIFQRHTEYGKYYFNR